MGDFGASSPMSRICCIALAFAMYTAAASASSAWSDFVSYTGPKGHAPASSSRRVLASTAGQTAQVQPSYVKDDANGYLTVVTVNKFISGNESTTDISAQNKYKIFQLCAEHSAGTSFHGTVKEAWAAAQSKSSIDEKNDFMPPECMACLAKGWGIDEYTPGFYLPCGCQQTCVDVSGNLKANWARRGIAQQDGTGVLNSSTFNMKSWPTLARNSEYEPLESCSAYLANEMVYSCPQIAQFHFVLWPSLLAGAAALFMAYSMMNMQLDMDSLLYTVGSSSKKDN